MFTNIVFTTSLGREFHSLIFGGKKETLATSFFALRTTNLKGWFPRVFLSLVYFIWAATKKYVSLWESLCIKDSPAVFILAAKVSAAFLSHLHTGPSCPRRIALCFSEPPPAFKNYSLRRDTTRHFHIRGLVGLLIITQQPFAKRITCGNGFDICQ